MLPPDRGKLNLDRLFWHSIADFSPTMMQDLLELWFSMPKLGQWTFQDWRWPVGWLVEMVTWWIERSVVEAVAEIGGQGQCLPSNVKGTVPISSGKTIIIIASQQLMLARISGAWFARAKALCPGKDMEPLKGLPRIPGIWFNDKELGNLVRLP